MVFECFVTVYEHDRNLLAVLFFQFRIRFDIDDSQGKAKAGLNTLDNSLRLIAQMTPRPRVHLNFDAAIHEGLHGEEH